MAPQRQRRPPELNKDVTVEILLRISPDEPADLIRASVVCSLWRRVLSDEPFLHRYRAFHRGVPLLGFFYNLCPLQPFPGFVPTTAASSPPLPEHRNKVRLVSDCRHGRVLLKMSSGEFVVWDPFSNHLEEVEAPRSWSPFESSAVVLCAVPGCDHRTCRGGPFHVVCVGAKADYATVDAHVYSSESRSWRTHSAQLGMTYNVDMKRAALIGDGMYFTVNQGSRIVKYDLVKHRLSRICLTPYTCEKSSVLMENEDGSLGIAGVMGSRLYLFSTTANAEGFTGWVNHRVFKLEEMLPVDVTCAQANVICFAEGVEVFFISTNAGAFTFELKSGRVRKVGEPSNYNGVTPFISFFTPDRGCSKWTK